MSLSYKSNDISPILQWIFFMFHVVIEQLGIGPGQKNEVKPSVI